MSVCETCIRPGECCRNFPLPSLPREMTTLEVMVYMATYSHPMNLLPGLPFINPRFVEDVPCSVHSPLYTGWVISCPLVSEDGRCTDYEHRPYWPCGAYEAGQDNLCAHHVPKIGLCPDLKQTTPAFQAYLGESR
jgi:hypothetical protein